MGYWITAFRESFFESLDQIAWVDLFVTVFGGAVIFLVKRSPLTRWEFSSKHPIFTEAWRLLALFVILFLISSIVIVPNRMFIAEHAKEIDLQKQVADLSAKLTATTQDDATQTGRVSTLSDALAVERSGLDQSKQVIKLQREVDRLQATALTAEPDPYEWSALTDAQIAEWTTVLSPYGIKTIMVWSGTDADAQKLLESFRRLKAPLNCEVTFGLGSPDANSEIEIGADDRISPALLKLCNELGKTKLDNWKGPASSRIDIFIGGKISPTPPSSVPNKSAPP